VGEHREELVLAAIGGDQRVVARDQVALGGVQARERAHRRDQLLGLERLREIAVGEPSDRARSSKGIAERGRHTALQRTPDRQHVCTPDRYRLCHRGLYLGGKFILAHLPPSLVGLRGTATAFLEGYGPETAARWRSSGRIVERVITSADAENQAVTAARDTFARLIRWLARFEARSDAMEGKAARGVEARSDAMGGGDVRRSREAS
jgi:hypothetical protein